jgi:methionyl-tRNA formyltransferase
MQISILTDNPESWMVPYVEVLKTRLGGDDVTHYYDAADMPCGDILFILSCERLLKPDALSKHGANIVVHPSALPLGRGWSPVAWQLLGGVNKIPLSLFEATAGIDEGPVYFVDYMILEGHELNDEIKRLQGLKVVDMCVKFRFGDFCPVEQSGEATYFPRRTSRDSQLDAHRSIADQFNLLRVVDNDRYPAFFYMNGAKYTLKIEKAPS